jgi:hypothetical protein
MIRYTAFWNREQASSGQPAVRVLWRDIVTLRFRICNEWRVIQPLFVL